ncbi:jg26768, partial [Pararge aegeria aegeria]
MSLLSATYYSVRNITPECYKTECFISDHVFKALEFADKNSDVSYKKNTVIHNPQIIRDVVKISGCRFKLVARPDEEVQEEE